MYGRWMPLLVAVGCLAMPGLAAEPTVKTRQKLYVTNSAGDDVTVIDLASRKVKRIIVGPHPHGLAVPASQDVIYVTIEGSSPGELVWIDPVTDTVVRRMATGPAPNELAVTPDGRWAYVPVRDGYWEVIDLRRAKIVRRIFVGGRPHNTVCSADGKHMYLAPMGDVKKVIIVEVATGRRIGAVAFSNVVRPVALSRDEKRLYAEVDGLVGFEVADVGARKVIGRVEDRGSPAEAEVSSRSHGIGIRPDQKELWEGDVEHHSVHVFDLTGREPKQIATIRIGSQVYWLTFSHDGKTCYVAARGANAVVAVDTATKKIIARMDAGKEPKRLLVVDVPEKHSR